MNTIIIYNHRDSVINSRASEAVGSLSLMKKNKQGDYFKYITPSPYSGIVGRRIGKRDVIELRKRSV